MASSQDLILWMTNNRAKVRRYGRILQALTGLFLVFMGYFMGHAHFHLILDGTKTQGKIVAYKTEYFQNSKGSSTSYMPVVAFRAGDRTIQFEDWLGSRSTGNVNVLVPVLYDPDAPAVAMIDRPTWNWIPWAPIFGVGVFLLLVSTVGWVRSSRPA